MKLGARIGRMKLNMKFTMVVILFAVVPVAILAGVMFYNMEHNVIDENINYMNYTMERNEDQIMTNIDSINMSTQFFLSDSGMLEVLNNAMEHKTMSAKEWLDFNETDVAALERLVNNNPVLYCVRVYAANDNVQEMMPVLYRNSRMQKLKWAAEEAPNGWYYGYYDTTFSSLINNQNESLAALVTPINDYDNGQIGTIEAAISMKTMFPSLYETIENEWSCFMSDDGTQYFGDNEQDNSRELLQQVLEQQEEHQKEGTYYTKIGRDKLIISYMPVKELGGSLISVQDITKDVRRIYALRNTFVFVMCMIFLALSFVINLIINRMLRQFYEISGTIRKVQKGNLGERIELRTNDEMADLSVQLNTMLDHIQALMKDNIDREVLAKNSEIRALQNQINAHFIYNVLESIKMMAEIEEKYEISDAITSLGKLLRYSMRWTSGNVLISEELEYIKNYMVLINLRFDYKIYLSINIPEMLMEQEIPKMSLQPIVENAILHGIEESAEDNNIYIKGRIELDECLIEITDAGRGMTESELNAVRLKIAGKIETTGGKGNGIGLKNVQDRIVMAFGDKYGLEFASKLGCYTKVTVRIPLKDGKRS